MSKLDELQAFIDRIDTSDIADEGWGEMVSMLQAALDQCESAMGEDETYNFVATYVLIDAMHGAMEADDENK